MEITNNHVRLEIETIYFKLAFSLKGGKEKTVAFEVINRVQHTVQIIICKLHTYNRNIVNGKLVRERPINLCKDGGQ